MSRHPYPSADRWLDLEDAARGRRRLRLDEAGRGCEVRLADGRCLTLERDGEGRLRRLAGSDGFQLELELPGPDRPVLAATDAGGTTELHLAGVSRALRRGAHTLRLEHDERGRLSRVEIPGSAAALLYDWQGDEACELRAAGGEAVLSVEIGHRDQRFRLGGGGDWREEVRLGRFRTRLTGREDETLFAAEIDLDRLGRVVERRFHDGTVDTFERDDDARLRRWRRTAADGTNETVEQVYADGERVAESGPGGERRFEVGPGGRIEALRRADGSTVRYRYDAAGRRVERAEADGRTAYRYDVLGQLVEINEDDGRSVRLAYDGFGRRLRLETAGSCRLEHRDDQGRLWAVTDGTGRALHTYLWWGPRMIARLNGPLGSPLAEAYLCDPYGTPLAVLDITTLEVAQPADGLYGAVEPARPSLYGHFGDAETGLLHFGARDLDPELGVFLTPDPWHGGEDDPRRLAGTPAEELARTGELPAAGVHPYALCQFDPVGRFDLDGHSGSHALWHFISGLTWGWPLTAISLFFFLPLNLYFEVLTDVILFIIGLFPGGFGPFDLPTSRYHVWNAIGGAASGRQGMFALGLNGFLPRLFSSHFSFSSPRAVTIGNVVWIDRDELKVLRRPRVLDVWDLAGPPDPALGGAPRAGATRFNGDPTKDSVVMLEGTDKTGKKHLHADYWTRGYGNTVVKTAAGPQLQDRPNPAGGTFSPGALHLAKSLSHSFPVPTENTSKEKLAVTEYLFTPGTDLTADGEVIADPFFALDVDAGDAFAVGDVLRVHAADANPAFPATYRRIVLITEGKVDDDKKKALVLDRPLPARFAGPPPQKENLKLHKVTDEATTVAGWQQGASASEVTQATPPAPAPGAPPAAPWPPTWDRGDVVKIKAGTPAAGPALPPGVAAPPAADTAYASLEKIFVTVKLAPAVAPLNLANVDLTLLRPAGRALKAKVPDPAKPAEIELAAGEPGVGQGDLLSIKLQAAPAQTTVARVTAVAGKKLTVDPPLGLALAGPTNVELQKHTARSGNKNKAKATNPTGDEVDLELSRTLAFPAKAHVSFKIGNDEHIRAVAEVKKVTFNLSDEVLGAGPFTLTAAKVTSKACPPKGRLSQLNRFIKRTAGDHPAAYGQYPAQLLQVHIDDRRSSVRSNISAFYAQPDAATRGSLAGDYHLTWKPQVVGTDEYWVLDDDLPVYTKEIQGVPTKLWRGDLEDAGYDTNIQTQWPQVKVRQLTPSGATCVDVAGRRVLAHPPEVQVPVAPKVHDTHDRALVEHELHHAVQNANWGPLLAAIPLQGLLMSTLDFTQAGTGDELPSWLQWAKEPILDDQGNPPAGMPDHIDDNTELNWAQVFSLGGLMQLTWKYVLLWPTYFSDDARRKIAKKDFSFWGKIFSPFWGLVLSRIPEVRPDAPADERWGLAFAKLFERAFDLRSWCPIPALLISQGDGPQSFLEQEASRASGDLYSTILSANDLFNLNKKHPADLAPALGDAVRLHLYASFRNQAVLAFARADHPGSPFIYQNWELQEDPVAIELGASFPAAHDALFHPELYELIPGSPAAQPPLTVEGPLPAAGGPRPTVDFLRVRAAAGTRLRPTLQALVPTPPRVNRSAGFYFLPAAPGPYKIEGFWQGKDVETHRVTLTAGGEVKLGEEDVPWELPPAAGAAPATVLKRFLTEVADLKVKRHRADGWTFETDPPAVLTAAPLADKSGWRLTLAKALPAGAGPHRARVRLYRSFKKDDPAFDLTYPDVPSLKDVRSYLTDELWVPVRDFLVELADLPVLPPLATDHDKAVEAKLPIPVESDRSFDFKKGGAVVAVPHQRRSGRPAGMPRGELWALGPFSVPPEETEVYDVVVRFGKAPDTVDRPFQLTVNPALRLNNATAGGAFEAAKDHPLTLDVVGGTDPLRVEATGSPAGTAIVIQGRQVKVTVATPPAADTEVVVTVIDKDGRKGRRKIKVQKS